MILADVWKIKKRTRRAIEASTTLSNFLLVYSCKVGLNKYLPAPEEENGSNSPLLVSVHLQIPDLTDGKGHSKNIEDDVGNRDTDIETIRIDALGRDSLVPVSGYWSTAKDYQHLLAD